MKKADINNIRIDNEEILNDPKGFIDKFNFSVLDKHARSAMNLAREIEQDSLSMMEKGFSMTRQIYDAELATNDHLTGLAKFFISLSATGIFAAVGLNIVNIQSYLLFALALPLLFVSVIFLATLLRRRNKVIKKRTKDYSRINDAMETVLAASKLRVKAMKSVAEDDPVKIQEMFKELGLSLDILPIDQKKDQENAGS